MALIETKTQDGSRAEPLHVFDTFFRAKKVSHRRCDTAFKIKLLILKNKSPTHILGEKSLCERVVVAQPTKKSAQTLFSNRVRGACL